MLGDGWVRLMVVGSNCGCLEVVACDGGDCWWLVVFWWSLFAVDGAVAG